MFKNYFSIYALLSVLTGIAQQGNPYYVSNKVPLQPQAYIPLPLGTIKPQSWLLHMLKLQQNGLTVHLDSICPVVIGAQNGWLGGVGDSWERGPYWLNGPSRSRNA